jgi:hypothetical protein
MSAPEGLGVHVPTGRPWGRLGSSRERRGAGAAVAMSAALEGVVSDTAEGLRGAIRQASRIVLIETGVTI